MRGQQQPGGLDKLILSGNRLGDTGVSSLAGALSRAQAAVAKARSADYNPSDEGASSGAALSQDVQNAAAAPYRGLGWRSITGHGKQDAATWALAEQPIQPNSEATAAKTPETT